MHIMPWSDVKVYKITRQIDVFRWNCPDCDRVIERRREPEDLGDAFCPECRMSEARKTEFLREFHQKYSYAYDGVNIKAVPDLNYWYDYDNGGQLPILGFEIVIGKEDASFIEISGSELSITTQKELPF